MIRCKKENFWVSLVMRASLDIRYCYRHDNQREQAVWLTARPATMSRANARFCVSPPVLIYTRSVGKGTKKAVTRDMYGAQSVAQLVYFASPHWPFL